MRDNKLILSDAQAVTVDVASTNVINFGVAGADPGAGRSVELNVSIAEAFNNLTSILFKVEDSADGSSYAEVTSKTVLLADLSLGAKIFDALSLPKGIRQHFRVYYDITGTAPTTGKINADLDI